ncbi:hypothetical protein M0802_003372 [Mischocyttarus mexicanus]|nr:hypothetical protein M0802_003372 [Mischocyttarus mexicanus]
MATFKEKNFRLADINAVFFDLDNTVIETRKADSRTCRKICKVASTFCPLQVVPSSLRKIKPEIDPSPLTFVIRADSPL